ncbi:hypothetical protein [Phyllobacterium ifriqiyense]|uniref:hypothetical protein n=1 Tax=Phyllobacterium ifriqiyense TaxID=314238 RepID=UPI00339AF30A
MAGSPENYSTYGLKRRAKILMFIVGVEPKRSVLTITWTTRLCFLAVCFGIACVGYLLIAIGGPDNGTSGAILTGFVAGNALVKSGIALAIMGLVLEIIFRIGHWWLWL